MAIPSLAMIPTGFKDGKLYSVLPESGVGDFTVTRGSGATRVNKNGLVEDVRILSGELVTNGDFSNGSTDWTLLNAELTINAVIIGQADGSFSQFGQFGVFTIGKQYKLTYDILEDNGGVFSLASPSTTLTTTLGSHTIYLTASSTDLFIKRSSTSTTTKTTFTNISVKEVTTDTDIPRLDYTDGGCPVLLTEPQSTNLITYSEDFSNASWAKTNSTIVANSTISPDGTLNASKVVETSAFSYTRVRQSFSFVSGNSYSFSVFYKANGRDFIQLELNTSAFPTNASAVFDVGVVAVDVLGAGADSASIKDFGNGWYRCVITATADTTTGALVAMYISETASISYQGDGVSGGYIWGAQVEALPYSTSYIPTSGAIATRLADSITGAGDATTFNSTEGVLYAEINFLEYSVSANNQISISDGSTSNRIMIYALTNTLLGLRFNSNGNQLVTQTVIVSNLSIFSKIAIRWGDGYYTLYQNGVEIYTQTIATPPIGLDRLSFSSVTGSSNFYGKTKDLRVYNTALTDLELQELTTI